MPKPYRQPSRSHHEVYNRASHQAGKAARELGKGLLGQQSVGETVVKTGNATINAILLCANAAVLQAFNEITAPHNPKPKEHYQAQARRNQAARANRPGPFNPADLQAAKKHPSVKYGATQAKYQGVEHAKQTNRSRKEQEKQEAARLQKIQDNEPHPFTKDPEDGTRSFVCQYKSCEQEFEVTFGQLADYARKGYSEPKACYTCRYKRYELFQHTHTTQTCEDCGQGITIPSEEWHGKLKTEPHPQVRDFCRPCSQRRKERENIVARDKQLSRLRADGRSPEHVKLYYKYRSIIKEVYEKEDDSLEKKQRKASKEIEEYKHVHNALLSRKKCRPVKDVPREPDWNFYHKMHPGQKETRFRHIEKHRDGTKDYSLGVFDSVEEAIAYAHYIAPLDNPDQFIDVAQDYPEGSLKRLDLVKNIEVVYSGTSPRYVITMIGHDSTFKTLNRANSSIEREKK